RRRHTRSYGDWSSDVCSSDLNPAHERFRIALVVVRLVGAPDLCDLPELFRPPRHFLFVESVFREVWFDACDVTLDIENLRPDLRSEERRVGKDGGYRWRPEVK